jgi:phosphohistidine phosphatase SixA
MEPPGITRHRGPFLAPLWVTFLAALCLAALAWAYWRGATTTVVFLVRPVDKIPATIADPPLSPEGEERAQRLAHMFGDLRGRGGGIDGIYESNDRHAQQTAAALVEQLHSAPTLFPAADARTALAKAVREHSGGSFVVVGGDPEVTQALREVSGAELPAPEDPDVIYVISIPTYGHANVAHFRF